MVITLEYNRLFIEPTGQPKFPLFAETETLFFLKAVDATVEFIKDDKGDVTHLIFKHGADNIKADRK